MYSSTTSPVVSNITIYDSSFPSNTSVFNFSSGELRYESVSAQTDISLQNGAVVMRPRINPDPSCSPSPAGSMTNQQTQW